MKFIGSILASILSLVYFFVLIAMSSILVIANVFSADYFNNILQNVTFSEIKLGDLGIESEEGATLEDLLVSGLKESGMNEEEAKRVINDEETREVASEFIVDAIEYFTNDGDIPQVKSEDIKRILESEEINGVDIDTLVDDVNQAIEDVFKGGEITYVGQ